MRIYLTFLLVAASLFLFNGCRREEPKPLSKQESENVKPVKTLAIFKSETPVRILMPADQASPWLVEKWKQKLGREVTVDLYEKDEEVMQKLNNPSLAYNVVFLSDRVIFSLIKAEKLAPLPSDLAWKKADPEFLHHYFDIDNRYTLPYGFSLTGAAYLGSEFKTPPHRWADLFSSENFKKCLLPSDLSLVQALKAKAGLSPEIADAHEDKTDSSSDHPTTQNQQSQTNQVSTITEDKPLPSFKMEINSMAELKKKYGTNPDWHLFLPDEGALIYLDHVALPANEPSLPDAEIILNEFFDPANLARFTAENFLATVQKENFKLIPVDLQKDVLVYPPEKYLDKCSFVRP